MIKDRISRIEGIMEDICQYHFECAALPESLDELRDDIHQILGCYSTEDMQEDSLNGFIDDLIDWGKYDSLYAIVEIFVNIKDIEEMMIDVTDYIFNKGELDEKYTSMLASINDAFISYDIAAMRPDFEKSESYIENLKEWGLYDSLFDAVNRIHNLKFV